MWEIAACGKPAIFVPYPCATGDHQALMDRDGIYAELFNLQAEGYRPLKPR